MKNKTLMQLGHNLLSVFGSTELNDEEKFFLIIAMSNMCNLASNAIADGLSKEDLKTRLIEYKQSLTSTNEI